MDLGNEEKGSREAISFRQGAITGCRDEKEAEVLGGIDVGGETREELGEEGGIRGETRLEGAAELVEVGGEGCRRVCGDVESAAGLGEERDHGRDVVVGIVSYPGNGDGGGDWGAAGGDGGGWALPRVWSGAVEENHGFAAMEKRREEKRREKGLKLGV